MSRAEVMSKLTPWAGLILAPLAWVLHHQTGSNLNYAHCGKLGTNGLDITLGLLCLAVIAFGALVSRRALSREPPQPTERFIASVSLLMCGLAGGAVLLSVTAGLIIPSCAR